MKVALQFDEPWDHTHHLAGKWWRGSLMPDGWVELAEPFSFREHQHHRVKVQPRYVGDELAHLVDGKQIVVAQTVETSDGSLGLIGLNKRVA